jgi:acetylornithine deacetylase/succinyl-diaminopimelate desuccinylase-like protein
MLHLVGSILTFAAAASASPPLAPVAEQKLAREIFQELMEIDTTHDHGSTTAAAEAVARRLRAAGWPEAECKVFGPSARKGNLVARLRGSGKRPPLMLLGHLDVVEARRDDWSLDPFKLTEKDGYFYGRGSDDMKSLVALWVATVLRLRREAHPLDRDLLLVLTADEESGPENGMQWLLAQHRPLIQSAYALNEGGGGEIKGGHARANEIQASEKLYVSFQLESRNKGGHSSLPEPDNAIVHLADALVRVHRHQFPARLNPVTRAYFERMAALERGEVAADMRALGSTAPDAPLDAAVVARLSRSVYYNARLRTTCVPTRVEGGHADNALPQRATALVNCRALPGESAAELKAALERVVADPLVSVTLLPLAEGLTPPPAPTAPPAELMTAVESITAAMWPGVVVLPVMQTGATDGRFLRRAGIPTFGVSGIFRDVDDIRAHGRDERIPVRSFYEGQEFVWRLVKALTGG